MKRGILCIAALALPGAAQGQDANVRLCSAIDDLSSAMSRTGRPQRVTVIKAEAMTFACGRTIDSPAQRAFCRAAMDAVGLEFTHGFPWAVHDCLRSRGIEPVLETTAQYTGLVDRPRIVHLTAQWDRRARIEIRYVPTGDSSDLPEFRGYWGRYELAVSSSR